MTDAPATELTGILADSPDSYEFTLLAHGVLPVRVVIEAVGPMYGGYAVVDTGGDAADGDSLVDVSLCRFPDAATGTDQIALFWRPRLFWELAAEIEREVAQIPAERATELAAALT